MLVEKGKQKCKEKLIKISSILFIIIVFIFIFPILLFVVIYIIFGTTISIKKIFKESGVLDCIQELFFDKKRIIELIQKRKQKLKLKNERLSREKISKKIKDQLSSSPFLQKEVDYIKNKYYKNKDMEIASIEVHPKREEKSQQIVERKSKSISSDFGKTKSIWDDYTSVLDSFKK